MSKILVAIQFWEEKLFQWIVANKQEEIIWNMIEEQMKLANEDGVLDEELGALI